MRILHSSDWHLGRRLYGYSLIEDQARVLDQFCAMAIALKPDLIVLAGDLYDIANPPADAVRLMNDVLTRLVKEGRSRILVIPGNHDSAERIGFAAELLAESGLWMVGGLTRLGSPLRLKDEHGIVAVHALPFIDFIAATAWLQERAAKREPSLYGAPWGSLLDEMRLSFRRKERNMLVAHAAVARAIRSDSEREIGTAEIVDAGLFSGFDYVALGHLHRPQSVGEDRVRYSGSLMKYSESEATQEKSATLVEMNKEGQISLEVFPFTPPRDLRVIEGSYHELSRRVPAGIQRQDYIFFHFSEDVAVPEAESALRRLYPNFMNLRWAEAVVPRDDESPLQLLDAPAVDDLELFRMFYRHTMDQELEPEMHEVLEEVFAVVDRSEEDE